MADRCAELRLSSGARIEVPIEDLYALTIYDRKQRGFSWKNSPFGSCVFDSVVVRIEAMVNFLTTAVYFRYKY